MVALVHTASGTEGDLPVEKLNAETRAIGAILKEDYFYRIPEYQRPFSWDDDNFEDLIDDIVSANKDQEYFLGTFVLYKNEKEGVFDVVDGQQRLTSMMILLACLRDLVHKDKFKTDIQKKILQEEDVVDNIPAKVRLEVKDRQIFKETVVIANGTLSADNKKSLPEPEWRYVNAVSIFRSRLASLGQENLEQVIKFISQKCVVIFLATPSFAFAFRLFSIVNDRGKQLRRIDILKATNLAPDVILKESVRNKISQQWEEIEKDLGEVKFESIFHLVRLILLRDKPQGDLLNEFEKRIFNAKEGITKGEPFFDLIFDYAKLYSSVFEQRDFIPEGKKDHIQYNALIYIMDSEFSASEWRACLLYFAKQFGHEHFYAFCLKMERVYLAQWVKATRKDERYKDYSTILGLIKSSKKAEDVIKGINFDEKAITVATQRSDFYHAGFAKFILLHLELVTAEHDALKAFSARSVEHVLPQNPLSTGYWADNHDLNKIKDYVDKLGNLVLLSKGKNSSASNLGFPEKKKKYLENRVSDYPRSIQVLKYKDWLKKTILDRTLEAKKLILQDP
jgi:uncharacterized protein with ParB-like and HNH nuclease domain